MSPSARDNASMSPSVTGAPSNPDRSMTPECPHSVGSTLSSGGCAHRQDRPLGERQRQMSASQPTPTGGEVTQVCDDPLSVQWIGPRTLSSQGMGPPRLTLVRPPLSDVTLLGQPARPLSQVGTRIATRPQVCAWV